MAEVLKWSVFVYGTLQRGQPNHYVLTNPDNGHAKLLGTAKTCEKWPLVIAGRYNTPYLLDCAGRGQYVTGETYEVDDTMMTHLNKLELYPIHYQCRTVKVKMVPNEDGTTFPMPGKEIHCEVYVLKRFRPELLELDTWDRYDAHGTHGLIYLPLHERPATFDCIGEVNLPE